MCGIFGVIASSEANTSEKTFRKYLEDLALISEPRGQEASGVVIINHEEAKIYKRGLSPSQLLQSQGYKNFIKTVLKPNSSTVNRPLAAIGHCRLATNGAETIASNNQPLQVGNSVGVHNGIITNDKSLWESHPEKKRHLDIDTEILLNLIDQSFEKGDGINIAVGQAFRKIQGSASLALFRNGINGLILATNFGSLYYCSMKSHGLFFFASEQYFLTKFLGNHFQGKQNLEQQIVQVKAGFGQTIPFDSLEPISFSLENAKQVEKETGSELIRNTSFNISEVSNRITKIKKCKKCILPFTYPFISFDTLGVCNFCRNYSKQKLLGRKALEQILDKYRSGTGKIDCLVAFSGGRDSSYGLHLLKNELGMEPIAFSYDWGMITDIARRNQARVVSTLKIEHIYRSADISSKRRYIRKNIHAWLKRPHLGMVPLFMAGDKKFFEIGKDLKKELGLDLIIWCAGNPLENCTFKAGFAGVQDSEQWRNFTVWSIWKKINATLFYLRQYILNPSYCNESLWDTFLAYRSSFISKDDSIYLYNYLEWEEEKINRTLIEKYDFQTSEHTDNFWRIGDGYTTFINYIYYSVAGFSEFDTFRSQQIRQGLITRQEALDYIKEENQPNQQILKEFALQVGINLEEVLTQIDRIKKLY